VRQVLDQRSARRRLSFTWGDRHRNLVLSADTILSAGTSYGFSTLMAASGMLRYLMTARGLETYFFFPAQLGLFLAGVLAPRFGARGS
jgi:hypothetical protein